MTPMVNVAMKIDAPDAGLVPDRESSFMARARTRRGLPPQLSGTELEAQVGLLALVGRHEADPASKPRPARLSDPLLAGGVTPLTSAACPLTFVSSCRLSLHHRVANQVCRFENGA